MRAPRALLLALILLSPGCMSVVSFVKGRPAHKPREETARRDLVMGGVRGWSLFFSRKLLDRSVDMDPLDVAGWWVGGALGLIDFPLSLSLDVLALPVTLAVSEPQAEGVVPQNRGFPKRQKLRRRR